ncbi:adenylyltransferase/cytidyltransferase family protein [Thalassospira alkalitolerans]|uniref:adenylyltransferase/cytidyltransferase family protein n=1 Tax=Thalassospira alkalitolerans TaxID=1293890 RepID=UPI003AA8A0C2
MINVLSLSGLREEINYQKSIGKITGLCHGCFDILHTGHIRHFKYAKDCCDVLYVSITADIFVNKGDNRPVFRQEERAEILSSISYVDGVYVNNFASSENLLIEVQPNIYFKGQEYLNNPQGVNKNFLKEKEVAISNGVEVKFTFEKVDSSTNIFDRIRSA